MIKPLCIAALVGLSLTGCATFEYGTPYAPVQAVPDKATVVVYRAKAGFLAPLGKAPMPFEVDGVAQGALNPDSFRTLHLAPGDRLFNARSGVIDLRRRADLAAGTVQFVRGSCYYVLTEAFCKLEPVEASVGQAEVAGLRESAGSR